MVVGNLFVICGAVELLVTPVEVNCLRVEGGTDLLVVDLGGNVEGVTEKGYVIVIPEEDIA